VDRLDGPCGGRVPVGSGDSAGQSIPIFYRIPCFYRYCEAIPAKEESELIIQARLLKAAIGAVLLLAGSSALLPAAGQATSEGSLPPPQTGVQIDNAESTSKPDDVQIPEANPARPTITNPAHIPPVGYVQFEQGFLQANGSPSALAGQFSLTQTFRLSVHPRLMVQFASQPLGVSTVPPGSDFRSSLQTDPGDLSVGLQGLLTLEKGHQPTVAISYQRRVRGGTAPDIDIGGFSQSATLLISGDLGEFHYDSNFSVSEQGDTIRRAQYGQTVSVTHDLFAGYLHNDLEISGELWHFTQPLLTTTRDGAASLRSNAVGTLWALGYSARPNLVLDAGFDRGLTSTSTAWEGFAGFTYLLPHRLWPRRPDQPLPVHHQHVHRR
jgi:hypothetical protein